MNTQSAQLKLTLPVNVMDFLIEKAKRYGIPTASYVRHVLIKEIESQQFPTYQASDWSDQQFTHSIVAEQRGEYTAVDSTEDFFNELEKSK